MTPEQEKRELFEALIEESKFLSTKDLTNLQLDLVQTAILVLENIRAQLSIESLAKIEISLEPGMKCEVNFGRPEAGLVSTYWQMATVLETDGLHYRTSATTGWIEASRVRVPQA